MSREFSALPKKIASERNEPLILLGQSLGAATGLYAASQAEFSGAFKAIVAESPFSSYRGIAKEKISASQIIYVLSYPMLFMVPDRYSPLPAVANVKTNGLLLLHGDSDQIIPDHHSRMIFDAAPEPKELWIIPGAGHLQPLRSPERREKLVEWIEAQLRK